jgi:hypothetical protein
MVNLNTKKSSKEQKLQFVNDQWFNVMTINRAIILESFEIKQWPLNLVIVQISILTQLNL